MNPFGPVQFQIVTVPDAVPCKLKVPPVQTVLEVAVASTLLTDVFTEILVDAETLPQLLVAVTT